MQKQPLESASFLPAGRLCTPNGKLFAGANEFDSGYVSALAARNSLAAIPSFSRWIDGSHPKARMQASRNNLKSLSLSSTISQNFSQGHHHRVCSFSMKQHPPHGFHIFDGGQWEPDLAFVRGGVRPSPLRVSEMLR